MEQQLLFEDVGSLLERDKLHDGGTTGRSWDRTPMKHAMLNSHLGKIVGVLSRPSCPAKACPFIVCDLCAGDGLSNEYHDSSPRIISKHVQAFRYTTGADVEVHFYEKAAATFDKLKQHLSCDGYTIPRHLHHADAREFRANVNHWKQAIFIHCDPNHVHNMPLTCEMVDSWTPFTTVFITLGCNVGGLKRKPIEERMGWYRYVNMVTDSLPRWHDSILLELNRDDKNWAYLFRLPRKWADDQAAMMKRTCERYWTKGVNVAIYRSQYDDFCRMVDRLFLRKAEREDEEQSGMA